MSEDIFIIAFIALLIYTIFRDVYLLRTIGELTNKLMSRNYGEYMQSQALLNQTKREVKLDDEPLEGFETLNEFR